MVQDCLVRVMVHDEIRVSSMGEEVFKQLCTPCMAGDIQCCLTIGRLMVDVCAQLDKKPNHSYVVPVVLHILNAIHQGGYTLLIDDIVEISAFRDEFADKYFIWFCLVDFFFEMSINLALLNFKWVECGG